MPVHTKKIGNKYYAVDKSGRAKKGRGHKTRAAAVKQVQAINLSMMRQGKIKSKRKPPPKKRSKK